MDLTRELIGILPNVEIFIPTYLPLFYIGNNSYYRPHHAGGNNITARIMRAVIILQPAW